MNKKQALIYGIILIVLFFFVPKAIKYLRFNKSVGIVTQISTGTFHGLRDSTSFEYPNILFITEKKQEVYYRKDNEVLFVMPEVGDKITVIYNPQDPKDAYLSRIGSFWFALPDLLLFGILIFLLIGVVNIVFVKSKKKKKAES